VGVGYVEVRVCLGDMETGICNMNGCTVQPVFAFPSHLRCLQAACHPLAFHLSFLCSTFTSRVSDFYSACLELEPSGLDPSMFVRTTALHLTLGVLKLYTPAALQAARKAVQDARQVLCACGTGAVYLCD
jgi:A-kinase anchor protein AKAP7